MEEFTVKCPVIVCTQTAHETKLHGNKCIKETNSESPVETDIVTVQDMSEIATENKVYYLKKSECFCGSVCLRSKRCK